MLSVKKFKASDLTLFFFWKKEIEEFFAFFFSLQQKSKKLNFQSSFDSFWETWIESKILFTAAAAAF